MEKISYIEDRDKIIDEINKLNKTISHLCYEAKQMERRYIENEFAKYGIIHLYKTRVRYKITGEVGEIRIVPVEKSINLPYHSTIRPFTRLSDNLRFYEAEFHPLTKKGVVSDRATKDTTYITFGNTIEKFVSYFEIVTVEK